MIQSEAAGMAIDIQTIIRVASRYGRQVNCIRLIVRWYIFIIEKTSQMSHHTGALLIAFLSHTTELINWLRHPRAVQTI